MRTTATKAENLLGAADPFFEITNDAGDCVARSVVFFNDLNPQWPPIKLDVEALCCGEEENRPVTISFFDFDPQEKHALIGRVATTVQEMKQAARDCQAQLGVTLLDKKESYSFDGGARVFVYDAISTTGVPTIGTLSKKKSASGGQDSTSMSPSSDSTEPETDSSSDEEQVKEHDDGSPMSDASSVCTGVSSDSTVMVANGDASPLKKKKGLFGRKKKKGKTLLVGGLAGLSKTLLVGGVMPTTMEEEEEENSKESNPTLEPALVQEQSSIAKQLPQDDLTTQEQEPDIDSLESSYSQAEQRGTEMAQQADDDVSELGDEYDSESVGSLSMADTNSVQTANVHDLLGEIDDILTGFTELAKRQQQGKATPPPPPKNKSVRNRIARMMGGTKQSDVIATASATTSVTASSVSSNKSRRVVGQKPSQSSPSPRIESPPSLKKVRAESVAADLMLPDDCKIGGPLAVLDLFGSNAVLKEKQCLDRPKKEYLTSK